MEEKTMNYPSMSETAEGFLKSDDNPSGIDRRGLEEDMDLVKGLVDSRDLRMLSQDLGEGKALGNSKTVIRYIREAAGTVRRMIDRRTAGTPLYKDNGLTAAQQGALKSEGQEILRKALMAGRAEWIRRSGRTLDGY